MILRTLNSCEDNTSKKDYVLIIGDEINKLRVQDARYSESLDSSKLIFDIDMELYAYS